MLSIGQRLRDRYRVDALPDAESGSQIFRGYDTVENRLCAIREFEGEQATRLEREAEALTLHRHPNLPAAFDVFSADGFLYIVFEWPEGDSLQTRQKRDGRLSEAEVVRVISQVLSALDYVYTLNLPIVRGGFSPANIWIAPDGRARLYAGAIAVTNAAPYLAPEGAGDARAAIYSAGATLYNLLTGRSPEGSVSPRKYNPTVSAGLAQAVQRALNPRPDARFVGIRDMRKALGRSKPGEVEEAPPARRPAPLPWIGGGILVVLAVAALAWNLWPGRTVAAPSTLAAAPTTVTAATAVSATGTAAPIAATASQPVVTAASAAATTTAALSATLPSPTATILPTSAATAAAPATAGTPSAGATQVAISDGMVRIYVPAGEFFMGSLNSDPLAQGNEKPQHRAATDAYWIDRTEVSNFQYRACLSAGACTQPLNFDSVSRRDYFHDPVYDNFPVIWVNWRQANAYCTWAGRRLPTEVEWEKAGRGSDGRVYPWGNQPPDNTLLNFNQAAKDTTAVGSFPNGASPFGVLDMAGNVAEWVSSFYYDTYFTVVSNPVTPTPFFHGGVRVVRSSGWDDPALKVRVAARHFGDSETSAFFDVGFRCAKSDK